MLRQQRDGGTIVKNECRRATTNSSLWIGAMAAVLVGTRMVKEGRIVRED